MQAFTPDRSIHVTVDWLLSECTTKLQESAKEQVKIAKGLQGTAKVDQGYQEGALMGLSHALEHVKVQTTKSMQQCMCCTQATACVS